MNRNEERNKILAFSQIAYDSTDSDFEYDITNAIEKLPDKLRVTVILFYFEDMSEKQTAEILTIPVGTVKSRLSKPKNLKGETEK